MINFSKKLHTMQNMNLVELFHEAQLSITDYACYGALISAVLLNLIGFILFAYCKKYHKKHSNMSEEEYNKLDSLLSINLLLTSTENILSWILFGIGFYGVTFKEDANLSIILCLSGFMISFICNTILQQKIVNLTKELNPEKQGSVYDIKFNKKWLASCDEAEQYLIYKCSYKAYQVTTITCLILTLLLAGLGMIFPIGILPILCVCLIWAIHTITYIVASMKITANH